MEHSNVANGNVVSEALRLINQANEIYFSQACGFQPRVVDLTHMLYSPAGISCWVMTSPERILSYSALIKSIWF